MSLESATETEMGAVGRYFQSKGFGWMVEVEEEDYSQRPLLEELDIDPSDILHKLKCVLVPVPLAGFRKEVVRDSPDFWGPLLVVILYSLISISGQLKVVSWIFLVWIVGSFVIYFLTRVLGGNETRWQFRIAWPSTTVTYSQCIGVIGYCLLPLSLLNLLLPFTSVHSWVNFLVRIVGIGWSTYSAASLLCGPELNNRKPLVFYPVLLLYIYFLSLYTGA